jgi:hypothetical protein
VLEDDLLPLRYLNDLLFCERRLALHLVEQIWKDNQYTTEGVYAHKKVDQSANLKRGDIPRSTGNKQKRTGACMAPSSLPKAGWTFLSDSVSMDSNARPFAKFASLSGILSLLKHSLLRNPLR